MNTCQQKFGCFLPRMNRVRGEGSSSYLSKGRLSMIMGSWLVQVNLRVGWAERCGRVCADTSGQKASGSGQNPTANPGW